MTTDQQHRYPSPRNSDEPEGGKVEVRVLEAEPRPPIIAIEEVATWLVQRGFSEVATQLLEASEEVQGEIANAECGEWLLLEEFCQNQAKLKAAYQSLEDTDDNPFGYATVTAWRRASQ